MQLKGESFLLRIDFFPWDEITLAYSDPDGRFSWPPLKLAHGWVMPSHKNNERYYLSITTSGHGWVSSRGSVIPSYMYSHAIMVLLKKIFENCDKNDGDFNKIFLMKMWKHDKKYLPATYECVTQGSSAVEYHFLIYVIKHRARTGSKTGNTLAI